MNRRFGFLLSILLFAGIILTIAYLMSGKDEEIQNDSISIIWWGSSLRNQLTQSVIDRYQETRFDGTIKAKHFTWNEYWRAAEKLYAASDTAFVIQQDYAFLRQWVAEERLLALDQYIRDGTIDLSYVYEPYIDAGRIGGELYGISLGINAPAVIYNYEIVKRAGLERPDVDWTWDDLVEMSIEIYQKTGVKTVPFFTTSPVFGFENWVRQTGGSFFSENGQSLGFSRSELLKEYFQIQLKLLNAGALVNVDRAFGLIKDEKDPYQMTGSWINFIWSNEFVNIKKEKELPLELFLLPRIENSKRPGMYLKPSMFFSITAGSGNERECAEFINFFIHNQQSNKILMGDRGVPIVEPVREAMRGSIDEDLKKVFNYIALVRDGNYSPIDPPDPPKADQVKILLKKITIRVLKEEISPEKGANDFIHQANLILSNKEL